MPEILVIDDDSLIQLLLRKALEKQGYKVISALRGEEGLELARKHHPALIICDWMLPGIDGLEVCRQVRQDADLTSSFFILLTARGTVEDRVQGLDAGADEFLSKPIENSELRARVRAGLRLYQANQALQLQKRELQHLNQELNTQKQALETELSQAAKYVTSILPKPVDTPLKIDSRYIPSMQLGGDCFDYFWLDPDVLAIYLLDTSGHGVGSALLSISVFNLIRSQSLDAVNFYQPSSVLTRLNQSFQMVDQGFKYFTMWYGIYDRLNHSLIYAGAGHPPALLLSKTETETEVKQLLSSGQPIGFFPNTSYSNSHCKVEPGSQLCVFSDGIYEFKQPDEEIFGIERFINLVEQLRQTGNFNLDGLLTHIQNLDAYSGYEDDVSILEVCLN